MFYRNYIAKLFFCIKKSPCFNGKFYLIFGVKFTLLYIAIFQQVIEG